MKKMKFLGTTAMILLISAFTFTLSSNWKIAPGHAILFAGTDAEGIFKKLKGEVEFDPNQLDKSKFAFTIDVNSINTGNGVKNKHAISDKWFDAKKHPEIKFISTSFSKTTSGYTTRGILEIRGTKKEITVPFTFTKNIFKANFSVNRLDFKVGTMEGMSKKVSNAIKLDVSIPVNQ